MVLVESVRVIVDRLDMYGKDSDEISQIEDASTCVHQQTFTKTSSALSLIHCQPTNQNDRNGMFRQFLNEFFRDRCKRDRPSSQRVVTEHFRIIRLHCDVRSTDSFAAVLPSLLSKKDVKGSLPTGKLPSLVRLVQQLNLSVGHILFCTWPQQHGRPGLPLVGYRADRGTDHDLGRIGASGFLL